MTKYIKRLRRAIKGQNYNPFYEEQEFPLVWELDYFIVNMVRVNLPNYNCGYPARYTEEERNVIKNRMIELSNKIHEEEKMRYKLGQLEEKVGYGYEDLRKAEEEFAKLLGENLYFLWD